MRALVVDKETLIVVNIIVADANIDPPIDGCYLVNVPDDSLIAVGDKVEPASNSGPT